MLVFAWPALTIGDRVPVDVRAVDVVGLVDLLVRDVLVGDRRAVLRVVNVGGLGVAGAPAVRCFVVRRCRRGAVLRRDWPRCSWGCLCTSSSASQARALEVLSSFWGNFGSLDTISVLARVIELAVALGGRVGLVRRLYQNGAFVVSVTCKCISYMHVRTTCTTVVLALAYYSR